MSDPHPLIRIQSVSKRFGDFIAVDRIDLDIRRGEFFALLGGSGCGKTTLLRMLAGFEEPTAGKIFIDGQDMTSVPPYERPVNMMFQSYALFPHMTVAANIGYGLKHETMTAKARTERVQELLDLVKLSPLALRKPHQLSGGQRQRVALARALARQPKLLLLDEPLAALDKKLREQTQFELMNIQQRVGITFVLVTHDQEEAMTLADRIAVMDKGQIIQTGSPAQIYEFPTNRFVAEFIGAINMIEGIVKSQSDGLVTLTSEIAGRDLTVTHAGPVTIGSPAAIAVRPEKITISREPQSGVNVIPGKVRDLGYFGKDSLYRVKLASGSLIRVNSVNARRTGETGHAAGWDDEVSVSFPPDAALLFET